LSGTLPAVPAGGSGRRPADAAKATAPRRSGYADSVEEGMERNLVLGIVMLVLGILVLVVPAFLQAVVGVALIVAGLLAITGRKSFL